MDQFHVNSKAGVFMLLLHEIRIVAVTANYVRTIVTSLNVLLRFSHELNVFTYCSFK